jgi:hypothetical protein
VTVDAKLWEGAFARGWRIREAYFNARKYGNWKCALDLPAPYDVPPFVAQGQACAGGPHTPSVPLLQRHAQQATRLLFHCCEHDSHSKPT